MEPNNLGVNLEDLKLKINDTSIVVVTSRMALRPNSYQTAHICPNLKVYNEFGFFLKSSVVYFYSNGSKYRNNCIEVNDICSATIYFEVQL